MGVVTTWQARGPRPHQEDRWVAERVGEAAGWLLAVFDGHGGAVAADLCAEAAAAAFAPPGPGGADQTLRDLVAGFEALTRGLASGTTASVAWVDEARGVATVAVVGDSPVLAVDRAGRAVRAPEHNARSNLGERAAALERGGSYEAGYLFHPGTGFGLQMARSLGDAGMGEVVSRIPDLITVTLGPGSVLVLATDGVLDPSHQGVDARAAELLALRHREEGFAAAAVGAWAEARGLQDNATVVVWRALGATLVGPKSSGNP